MTHPLSSAVISNFHRKSANFALSKNTCIDQFVIFKSLSYCFEETIVFYAKVSFASRPLLRLIR